MPLFCPIWFSSQMWILQFDEDLGPLARKIWNKFGLVLRTQATEIKYELEYKNFFHYLRHPNFHIFDTTIKAVSGACDIFKETHINNIINDVISFFRQEWDIIQA